MSDELALRVEAAYGDPSKLDRSTHPGGQVGCLLTEEPHHLRPDGATAKDGDLEGSIHPASLSASGCPPVRDVQTRTITRGAGGWPGPGPVLRPRLL